MAADRALYGHQYRARTLTQERNRTINRVVLATAALIALAACQTQPTAMSAAAYDAKLACDLEAAKVSGYNWIDAASRRNEVRNLCLQQRQCWKEGGTVKCAADIVSPNLILPQFQGAIDQQEEQP